MIKTLEQYEALKNGKDIVLSTDNHSRIVANPLDETVELIEALRKVARAASNYAAFGYMEPCHHWRQPLGEALASLPSWIIDNIEEE